MAVRGPVVKSGLSAYSRPAESQSVDMLRKRKPDVDPNEPVDDNQFGVSPKQPKVKKNIIVSGGLCGFKARLDPCIHSIPSHFHTVTLSLTLLPILNRIMTLTCSLLQTVRRAPICS